MRAVILNPKSSGEESWWMYLSRWLLFVVFSTAIVLLAEISTMLIFICIYEFIPWGTNLKVKLPRELSPIVLRELRKPMALIITLLLSIAGIIICFIFMFYNISTRGPPAPTTAPRNLPTLIELPAPPAPTMKTPEVPSIVIADQHNGPGGQNNAVKDGGKLIEGENDLMEGQYDSVELKNDSNEGEDQSVFGSEKVTASYVLGSNMPTLELNTVGFGNFMGAMYGESEEVYLRDLESFRTPRNGVMDRELPYERLHEVSSRSSARGSPRGDIEAMRLREAHKQRRMAGKSKHAQDMAYKGELLEFGPSEGHKGL